MNRAIDKQAGAQIAGVNAGAGQAISGYQRGAAQARTGVEFNYGKEIDANKAVYVSQVNAAGQVRDAGLEAAKLRQAAAVIAQVGREILARGWTRHANPILTREVHQNAKGEKRHH